MIACRGHRAHSPHLTSFPRFSSKQKAGSNQIHLDALMDIPQDALTSRHAGSSVTVGSPHLFHALARRLPGVSRQDQVEKIANDVMGVIRDYTSLHAAARQFWTNEGTEELRVCIKGLVTTTFKGNSYQTPIVIWLSNRYPQTPPDFYVDTAAAPNMIVPQDHLCISPDGQVRSSRMPALYSYCMLLLYPLLSLLLLLSF